MLDNLNLFKKSEGDDDQIEEEEAANPYEQSINSQMLENLKGNGKMQGGDYVVHVHIQSTKNLDLDGAQTFDPYINVRILEQSKDTSVKQNVDKKMSTVFNEHLFFEFQNIDNQKISAANIEISVFNKGYFKGDLIGKFTLSLQKVYNIENHVMLHQQLALNNDQNDDFSKITGLMVISVNVQGPQDTAVQLNMGSGKDVLQNKCLMPPQVNTKFKQFHFRLYMAQHLPKMDTNFLGKQGSIDAYTIIKYNNQELRSEVITQQENEQEIKWMEEFLIPIEIPAIKEKLEIQIWDQDKGRDGFYDDLVGSIDLNMKSILKYSDELQNTIKWINIFGSDPEAGQDGIANEMNKDAKIATHWKGRILVEYFVEPSQEEEFCKFPELKKRKMRRMKEKQQENFQNAIRLKEYLLIGEFGRVIGLRDDEDYNIQFSLAEYTDWSTKDMMKKGTKTQQMFRWDEKFGALDGKKNIQIPYKITKRFPTFYFYLLDKNDKPVAYYRDTLLNYIDPRNRSGPIQWRSFVNNPCFRTPSKYHAAEMFSFRLYLWSPHEQRQEFLPLKMKEWTKKAEPRQLPWKMRINIYQCRNLVSYLKNDTINPYVQVWTGLKADPNDSIIQDKPIEEIGKSHVCLDTSNPVFYEVVDFNGEYLPKDDYKYANPLIINIYNKNKKKFKVFSKDEYLGRAVIKLNDQEYQLHCSQDDRIPEPGWFPIKRDTNDEWDEETGAAILCSFQMKNLEDDYSVESEEIQLNRLNPRIQMPDLQIQDYQIEIVALGLQNLVSTGLFPVNRAYMNFNLKSLLPISQADAIKNIQTQPNKKGPSPNIKSTIQFEVQMPKKPEYMQQMQVEVFDQLYLGDQRIGSFQFNLGEIFLNTKKSTDDWIQKIQIVRKELQENMANVNLKDVQDLLKDFYEKKKRDQMNQIQGRQSNEQSMIQSEYHIDENQSKLLVNSIDLEFNDVKLSRKNTRSTGTKIQKQFGGQALLPSTSALRHSRRFSLDQFLDKENDESYDKQLKENDFPNQHEQRDYYTKKYGPNYRKKVEQQFQQLQNLEKLLKENSRIDAQQSMNRPDQYDNVILPEFTYDERLKIDKEKDIPSKKLFYPVGHIKDINELKKIKKEDKLFEIVYPSKHYRRFYTTELEYAKDVLHENYNIFKSPFIKQPIFRNEKKKSNIQLANLFGSGQDDTTVTKVVGHFKCSIHCYPQNDKQELLEVSRRELHSIMNNINKIYKYKTNQEFPINIDELDKLIEEPNVKIKDKMSILRDCINEIGLKQSEVFPTIQDIIQETQLINMLSKTSHCKVRVYVLDGYNFAQRDMLSKSDPYLIVKCGDQKHDDRENYQLDEDCPRFFKCFEFSVEFPGSPLLQIIANDYDEFFGDDLIGETQIDLDDRFYSQGWSAIQHKPIEFRSLYESTSNISQGVIKLWCEIWNMNSTQANHPPMDIEEEPHEKFEVRLCIHHTENIEKMDKLEDTSDVYIYAYFKQEEKQQTDIHWRCQTGKASFNYRIILPTTSDEDDFESNILNIEVWDKDVIASDDRIGSIQLDIKKLIDDCKLTKKPQHFNEKDFKAGTYFDFEDDDQYIIEDGIEKRMKEIKFEDKQKFWVPIEQSKEQGKGWVLCELQILPEEIAKKHPQGKGREDPNSDPYLPEPQWRIKMSFNPVELFNQLLGPAARKKLYCVICCLLCVFLWATMAPMIFSNLITAGFTEGVKSIAS